MMKNTISALALAVGLGVAGAANAGTIVQTFSIPVGGTPINATGTFDFFDDLGGTRNLTGVELVLDATVSGDARGENETSAPATITLDLSADVSVDGPDSLGLDGFSVEPLVSQSFSAAAFDGSSDFAGPSGASFTGLTDDEIFTGNVLSPLLPSYVGTGTFDVDFSIDGNSNASGAGTITTQFETQGGADITLTYFYDTDNPPEIPAPAALALLGAGLTGLGVLRSRR